MPTGSAHESAVAWEGKPSLSSNTWESCYPAIHGPSTPIIRAGDTNGKAGARIPETTRAG